MYVNQARPALRTPELFISVLAPFRPLTRASVTHIVRSALRRAGIKAPINGAHVLRHSVATTMLRQGASLAGVGAVLRHRDPMTTAHYAKVDFGLLSEIAQPWPEVSSCQRYPLTLNATWHFARHSATNFVIHRATFACLPALLPARVIHTSGLPQRWNGRRKESRLTIGTFDCEMSACWPGFCTLRILFT